MSGVTKLASSAATPPIKYKPLTREGQRLVQQAAWRDDIKSQQDNNIFIGISMNKEHNKQGTDELTTLGSSLQQSFKGQKVVFMLGASLYAWTMLANSIYGAMAQNFQDKTPTDKEYKDWFKTYVADRLPHYRGLGQMKVYDDQNKAIENTFNPFGLQQGEHYKFCDWRTDVDTDYYTVDNYKIAENYVRAKYSANIVGKSGFNFTELVNNAADRFAEDKVRAIFTDLELNPKKKSKKKEGKKQRKKNNYRCTANKHSSKNPRVL